MQYSINYKILIDHHFIYVGDSNPTFLKEFLASNVDPDRIATLFINLKGFTHAKLPMELEINDQKVGFIFPYSGEDSSSEYWQTQIICIPSSVIVNGMNELKLNSVTWPRATYQNKFDDFQMKDMIIFIPISYEAIKITKTCTKTIYRTTNLCMGPRGGIPPSEYWDWREQERNPPWE